jgi:transglutaminase-like putative cysteine protease
MKISLPQALKGISVIGLVFFFVSCSTKKTHIYSDYDYSKQVEAKFSERKTLAANRDSALFDVFNQDLTEIEIEGLKFLFAFMPLNDLADYDGCFFLKQVRWSLAARDTFAWGGSIPEDLFRHFVLPYRVNNENLDTARMVFFYDLKDRIKNMNMLDAALEVNHWCHEKVTYRGSDIRTSSPLATLKTAYGRCGEESTFTVAALRAVAIPARQVYTPRWAHSDDNHAWVEFWADGQWHYLGACEPECVPNLGWFTEPARRAMLIHTKAFGQYLGNERAENYESNYALLNTLKTYAQTKELHVKVIGASNNPVKNAKVEFQLYNYAEYYPISVKRTDERGYCNFLTGFGDLFVWAYEGDNFGYQKITVADIDTISIVLNQKPYGDFKMEFDMNPPILAVPLNVAIDCRDRNNLLLQKEDSIRADYEKTFRTEDQALDFSRRYRTNPDETWTFLSRSRGNYLEIEDFLSQVDSSQRTMALKLLSLISDKDLRDTKADVLLDHLVDLPKYEEPYFEALLNPRVSTEMLVPYRSFLLNAFGAAFVTNVRENPSYLISWVRQEIKLNAFENYYNTALTPVGVFNLKVADEDSREIFTVACFRSFGIPSRLKPGTLEVEYWAKEKWNTANFFSTSLVPIQEATLALINDPLNQIRPQYETHYTLAHFIDGKYHTLSYGYDHYGDPLKTPIKLVPGYYLLVTGNRIAEGKVLSSHTFFELKDGERKELLVSLRKSEPINEVVGTIEANWQINPLDNKPFDWKSILKTDRAIIFWIEPDKETSKHVFQDLGILKKEIDQLNSEFIFLIPENKLPSGFNSSEWGNLPASSRFATIPDLMSLQELERSSGKSLSGQLPVVIRLHDDGRVTYLSSGYKIGIGEELIKEIGRN